MILGFPSGDTGFPAFWQCWREKVPQDAEKEKVNYIKVPPAVGKEASSNLIHESAGFVYTHFVADLYLE